MIEKAQIARIYDSHRWVSQDIINAFKEWFQLILRLYKKAQHTMNTEIIDDFVYLVADASAHGAGIHILLDRTGSNRSCQLLHSEYVPFPAQIDSIIIGDDVFSVGSVLRESWTSLTALKLFIEKQFVFNKRYKIYIQSDNLGWVFSTFSGRAAHEKNQQILRDFIILTSSINEEVEVIWRPRWKPSAMSSDLASKLPPWYLTELAWNQISEILNISESLLSTQSRHSSSHDFSIKYVHISISVV